MGSWIVSTLTAFLFLLFYLRIVTEMNTFEKRDENPLAFHLVTPGVIFDEPFLLDLLPCHYK